MSYRGFERQRQIRTDIRENFGATQFSTFSTVSATFGLMHRSKSIAIRLARRQPPAKLRNDQAKGLGGFEVDDQLEHGRLLDRQIGRLCPL
jgi:hypothetical protein